MVVGWLKRLDPIGSMIPVWYIYLHLVDLYGKMQGNIMDCLGMQGPSLEISSPP